MGEAQRCRPSQNVDSDQIRTTLFGKGVFHGADIQRRRVELVSEIRVFLVVRLAIDVNLVKEVERRSDTGNREAQLKKYEEKQGYDYDRNEREGNFSYVGHGVFPQNIGRTIASLNIA